MPNYIDGIITRTTTPNRVHVTDPHLWAEAGGTDYWANFGNVAGIAADAIGDLDLYGWVTTGYGYLAGVDGSFLDSSGIGVIGGANFDVVSDHLISPFIFGSYAHGQVAKEILGHDPTTLTMECYARFAANADEEATGFGFSEQAAAVPQVKAGHMAFITSDGTNFSLESGAAAATSIDLDDTDPHLWKIVFTAGSAITWYIDGVLQTNTLALQTDLFPMAWGAATKATDGTNDPVISWVHIWYE